MRSPDDVIHPAEARPPSSRPQLRVSDPAPMHRTARRLARSHGDSLARAARSAGGNQCKTPQAAHWRQRSAISRHTAAATARQGQATAPQQEQHSRHSTTAEPPSTEPSRDCSPETLRTGTYRYIPVHTGHTTSSAAQPPRATRDAAPVTVLQCDFQRTRSILVN